jgi:hypothetical protein
MTFWIMAAAPIRPTAFCDLVRLVHVEQIEIGRISPEADALLARLPDPFVHRLGVPRLDDDRLGDARSINRPADAVQTKSTS